MPNSEEIKGWLLETLRHSCQVEYYVKVLGASSRDPDRPHDIAGRYNKLEWEIIDGCALAYRQGLSKEEYEQTILPRVRKSVSTHRQQYHHLMWNEYNEEATAEDLRFGALDTICALFEKRPYYLKCVDSLEELEQNVDQLIGGKNKLMKVEWVSAVAHQMKGVERPDIYRIEDLERFPNIGLADSMYNNIAERMAACLRILKGRGYDLADNGSR